jgi:dipeptidyl aminopeptidase/acylaminoacyl peptidase
MLRSCLLAAAAAVFAGRAVAAPADGELLSATPCASQAPAYEAYVAAAVKAYQDEVDLAAKLAPEVREPSVAGLPAALMTRAEYEATRSQPTACRHIYYGSDGLRVAGYIWEPAGLKPGVKLPVIVVLRGGNRDFGQYGPLSQQGMWAFVHAGFLVIGVQYRGVDGGEGADQFGGDDVHDVTNAVALARRLPEADGRNVFLYGTSRGGMMVYLALEQGAPVRVAATVSPFADLALEARRRPAMEANVWRQIIPGYDAHRQERLDRRSGVRVAREADLPPMLLMHGTADWRADPRNTLEVADALKARARPYALHIFDNDVHGLTWNWRERDRLAIAWFRDHMAR